MDNAMFFSTWLILLCALSIFSFIIFSSDNTYFAITNKRIILRSGVFNSRYIHYSLKNVGTVEVVGSILDSKGSDGSAPLYITTKDFHTNTDGNTSPTRLTVSSIQKAYQAYSVLSEKVEGNNEVLRVKNEN